jgi:hypothetical protein
MSCFSSIGAVGGRTLKAVEELNLFESFMALWGGTGRLGAGVSTTLTSKVYSHAADNVSGALHASEIGITNPFYSTEIKQDKGFEHYLHSKIGYHQCPYLKSCQD